MSVELFNACAYLVDRQVEAGLGGHLAVTGPAGSAREVLTLDGLPKTATGKIQRNVVREIVSAKLGK
jgi:acyl-coenzyme A synthetase/AMP-(fatty) acid ligase